MLEGLGLGRAAEALAEAQAPAQGVRPGRWQDTLSPAGFEAALPGSGEGRKGSRVLMLGSEDATSISRKNAVKPGRLSLQASFFWRRQACCGFIQQLP